MSRRAVFVLGLGLGSLAYPLWIELGSYLARVNGRAADYVFGVK